MKECSNGHNIRVLIIGIGDCGNNYVNSLLGRNIAGFDLLGVNTEVGSLRLCNGNTLQIGKETTKGFQANGNPEVGEKAAIEATEQIKAVLSVADLVIITCGLGGGTGTGAAPVIARIAKESGIRSIGVVSTPFGFENSVRMKNALKGIENLLEHVESLTIIPNHIFGEKDLPEILRKSEHHMVQTIIDICERDVYKRV